MATAFHPQEYPRGLLTSWVLYDLANQFFALNITSLYFPQWMHIEKGAPELFYALAFGASMMLVALFGPLLGAYSDMKNRHGTFLTVFTLLAVVFTAALAFTTGILPALVFFAIANFGCQEAIIFYNSLMIRVTSPEKAGFVSGLGRMFGYGGAIIALYLSRPVFSRLGFQPVFFTTAVFFLLFAMPCMLFLRDRPAAPEAKRNKDGRIRDDLSETLAKLSGTLFGSGAVRGMIPLMISVFFLLCAVNTIMIFMSVYATRAYGLNALQITDLIAFSSVFAMAGSLISGWATDRIGYEKAFPAVFVLWGITVLCGAGLRVPFHWIVGAMAGMSLGATWVVLRVVVVRIVPQNRLGSVFGLFNLAGYFAGIVGPVTWGIVVFFFSKAGEAGYRLSFLSISLFIIAGSVFARKVKRGVV